MLSQVDLSHPDLSIDELIQEVERNLGRSRAEKLVKRYNTYLEELEAEKKILEAELFLLILKRDLVNN